MNFKIALAAAAVVGLAGTAQAADLAKKAPAAADYVKVCDAYGAGFFYIPGSDTCLKIGGYVRVELRTGGHNNWLGSAFGPGGGTKIGGNRNSNNIGTRTRVDVQWDARTNTEFGLLRSYIELRDTIDTGNAGSNVVNVFQGFIQFAGLTVGRASSMFDFVEGSYNMGSIYETDAADHRINLFAYTFSFGNGISATLSAEDPATTDGVSLLRGPYSAVKMPDIVANVAIAQAWGRAQIMAALHQNYSSTTPALGMAGTVGANADKLGWAIGGGVEVNLPMLAPGDKVFLQAVYAKGAVGYALNNAGGYVGIFGPVDFNTNGVSISQSKAWTIAGGIHHEFSKTIEANLGASYADYRDDNVVLPLGLDNDFKQVVVNAELRWKPVSGFYIAPALEYRWVDYKDPALSSGNSWAAFVRVQRAF